MFRSPKYRHKRKTKILTKITIVKHNGGVMIAASVVLVAMPPAAALGHPVSLVVAACPLLVQVLVVVFVGMRGKASAEPSTYLEESN